ncbi:MAG TPA: MBOAT family protein [Sulfurimonas sp.]|nr:MBOAT family protein [Sulfurimonas sp.]
MLFNSYEFIFAFLPLSFFIYFYLLSLRLVAGAKGFLVFASLFFYSWWNISYLPIILASMLFNYSVGTALNSTKEKIKVSKKILLSFAIMANISLLGYYKYSDFFLENFNLLIGSNVNLLHLALPLAISFFTFQQVAYLVDSYRGETKEYDFLNYALFVTFFPQLIAGPIVHHKEMMPQFASKWNMIKRYKNIVAGIFIFSIGLFKKVVIADAFAQWANSGFDVAGQLNLIEAWITSLSYTFQLYFDFSGYTDMAIGIALLFNIKLPMNFNSPYKALDIQDFWRRWHITLSRFLKEYIYIPLGGNKNGSFNTYTNLLATFLLGGIWHGAGWTFLIWGFLHGIALIVHRLWQKLGIKLPKLLAWFITFNFINIAWVFFRAKEWNDSVKVLSSMFSLDYVVLPNAFKSTLSFLQEYGVEFGRFTNMLDRGKAMAFIAIGFILILVFKNSMQKLDTFEITRRSALISGLVFLIAFLSLSKASEFLYFNF